jgi:hypothetical protein
VPFKQIVPTGLSSFWVYTIKGVIFGMYCLWKGEPEFIDFKSTGSLLTWKKDVLGKTVKYTAKHKMPAELGKLHRKVAATKQVQDLLKALKPYAKAKAKAKTAPKQVNRLN